MLPTVYMLSMCFVYRTCAANCHCAIHDIIIIIITIIMQNARLMKVKVQPNANSHQCVQKKRDQNVSCNTSIFYKTPAILMKFGNYRFLNKFSAK